jgi:hypothetical protein
MWRVQAANDLARFHNNFVSMLLKLGEIAGVHRLSNLLEEHTILAFELTKTVEGHI